MSVAASLSVRLAYVQWNSLHARPLRLTGRELFCLHASFWLLDRFWSLAAGEVTAVGK